MKRPEHLEDVSGTDLAIFHEQQKTKRAIIHWSFGSGLFLVFCVMVTIAGLSH